MVHIFKTNGRKIAYDTTSGAFVGLSSLANKMMGALTAPLPPVCPTSLRYELAKYDSGDVSETYKQLYRLFEEGLLFCEEKDGACILLEGEYAPKSEEEIKDALSLAKASGVTFACVKGSSALSGKAKDIIDNMFS